ncbi:probable E3 ubiquitin-protein ligase RHG1A [Phalaenopsis equestris]|uniref:probable E3 ubiquitin-protein ligase RHG1A n=1 Tax=Phalaenopsis equestris TaxID=78828 RepID=UPI0009E2352E|nr:probable E3 ubiquitin-protein ligase RHG1A [Phalaenopsis equestris]
MASADGSLPSPGRRNLRRLLQLRTPGVESADQNPLTSLSSSRPPPQEATTNVDKRKSIASQTFLGLGCSSSASSQVCAPGAAASTVRSSADWQGRRTVRRRHKNKKKERRSSPPVAPVADVWCSPGIALVAVDDSVDCVVSQRDPVGRGFRRDNERILRERTSSGRAFSSNGEQISLLADSFSSLQASLIGSDLIPSRHYDHVRGYCSRPPVGLQEIMLLENRISFGRGDSFDQYRHWRLDVDNMTYEELLELGDKIGHVSTGLMEEEIACSIRKAKHTMFDRLFSNVTDRKCSICQEEFEMNIEVGKLGCGHSYHPYCIKKWLLQKNACPVCKTSVTKT